MKRSNASFPKLALHIAWGALLLRPAGTALASDPCQAEVHSPSDLSLTLSIKNDQTVFRQGEVIPLVLRYASTEDGKYIWNSRSYDRSGRLEGLEVFCLNPDAGKDPLEDYYESQFAFIGGGLFSEPDLGPSGQIIERELNEWESLSPGWYSLSVVGTRVSRGNEGDSGSWNQSAIQLKSNTVSFQIIQADPAWQSGQLLTATQALDAKSATPDEKDHAARVIRFLGTEESMEEAVRRFAATPDDQSSWEFEAGIWASPFRDDAIREMKTALEVSGGKINRFFVTSLVQLEMQSDLNARLSLSYQNPKAYSQEMDRYYSEMNRRVEAYNAEYGVAK